MSFVVKTKEKEEGLIEKYFFLKFNKFILSAFLFFLYFDIFISSI